MSWLQKASISAKPPMLPYSTPLRLPTMTESSWPRSFALAAVICAMITACSRQATGDKTSEKEESRPSSSEAGKSESPGRGSASVSAKETKQGESETADLGAVQFRKP